MTTATKKLSNTPVAHYSDYDGNDCTDTGYDWTLYSDGRVAVESHSRWQGSRSDTRWTTEAGFIDVTDPIWEGDFPAKILRLKVEDIDTQDLEDGYLSDFRQTKPGYIVQ